AYTAVKCADRVAIMERTSREQVAEEFPVHGEVIGSPAFPDICRTLRIEPVGEAFRDTRATDVPTLLLAGEYDPVTPPSYARDATERLGDEATLVEFPGLGHGATRSHPCAQQIFHAFLDDPTAEVDATCAEGMTGPEWVLLEP